MLNRMKDAIRHRYSGLQLICLHIQSNICMGAHWPLNLPDPTLISTPALRSDHSLATCCRPYDAVYARVCANIHGPLSRALRSSHSLCASNVHDSLSPINLNASTTRYQNAYPQDPQVPLQPQDSRTQDSQVDAAPAF